MHEVVLYHHAVPKCSFILSLECKCSLSTKSVSVATAPRRNLSVGELWHTRNTQLMRRTHVIYKFFYKTLQQSLKTRFTKTWWIVRQVITTLNLIKLWNSITNVLQAELGNRQGACPLWHLYTVCGVKEKPSHNKHNGNDPVI